jgi:hypothetical protein
MPASVAVSSSAGAELVAPRRVVILLLGAAGSLACTLVGAAHRVPAPAAPAPRLPDAAAAVAPPTSPAAAFPPLPTAPPSGAWADLVSRPAELLEIQPGAPCPRTARQPAGPVRPMWFGNARDGLTAPFRGGAFLHYQHPDGTSWPLIKVVWFVDAAYRGPVLIRGRQLDGPNALVFGAGSNPYAPALTADLRIGPEDGLSPSGVRDWPSYTVVRAPGCYGYQIDGLEFTPTIVFEVLP